MKVDKRNNLTTRLAYIAGFIDGEGCVRIKKSNKNGHSYYLTVQVTNTDKLPLLLIQSVFGGKVYFQEKGKNKVIWQYYITCSEAADLLRTLSGFLISKKPQAELAISFHDQKERMTNEEKLISYERIAQMKRDIYEKEQPTAIVSDLINYSDSADSVQINNP